MPDIPAEAVQAAAEAIEQALMSGEDFAMAGDSDEHLARAALEAAAPILAAQVRRETAEQIVDVIEAACPFPQPHEGPCDFQEAARLAREIGEAP